MPDSDRDRLRQHLNSLTEDGLRSVLMAFFRDTMGRPADLHGTAEHGIDIAVRVPTDKDLVGKGLYLLVQVKCRNITASRWRNEVLGQLCESSYYPIRHQEFTEDLARRLILVTTGRLEQEVRQSVVEYNDRHRLKVEVFELEDLVGWLVEMDYVEPVVGPAEYVGLLPEAAVDVEEYGGESRRRVGA